MAQKRTKRRERWNVPSGNVYIHATFNNTIIAAADFQGNVLAWRSSGSLGFKGARKATPYAAQVAAESLGKAIQENGLKSVEVFVCGPGSGRESSLRALQEFVTITSVSNTTPIPHNGCRPSKRRRV